MDFSPTMKYAIPPNLEVPNLEQQIREELIEQNNNLLDDFIGTYLNNSIGTIILNGSSHKFKIIESSAMHGFHESKTYFTLGFQNSKRKAGITFIEGNNNV